MTDIYNIKWAHEGQTPNFANGYYYWRNERSSTNTGKYKSPEEAIEASKDDHLTWILENGEDYLEWLKKTNRKDNLRNQWVFNHRNEPVWPKHTPVTHVLV